jgi:hypothetical protein
MVNHAETSDEEEKGVRSGHGSANDLAIPYYHSRFVDGVGPGACLTDVAGIKADPYRLGMRSGARKEVAASFLVPVN